MLANRGVITNQQRQVSLSYKFTVINLLFKIAERMIDFVLSVFCYSNRVQQAAGCCLKITFCVFGRANVVEVTHVQSI